ncbi:MAG: hypothetical protein HYV07_27145 [Deltaproteobacteria bacterium]|nr:hypothetical protein [Deltaproteobacteria bacterium]
MVSLASLGVAAALMMPGAAFADGSLRLAWAGLSRGPLAPADATAIEHQLVDGLTTQGLSIVDIGGRPLSQKALEEDVASVRRLIAKGIDHLLEMQYVPADEAIDQAIDRFEARLTSSEDYGVLEDALRTKAESHAQQGRKEQARTVLMRLAALDPKAPPNEKTHLPTFVKLYQEAEKKLGERAMLEVRADGAEIYVDGRLMGASPVSAGPLLPGRHYVVARWTNGTESRVVQLSAGRPLVVELLREGPAEQLRRDLVDVAELKKGQPDARDLAERSAQLAEADQTLVAAAKTIDQHTYLLLALHDKQGRLLSIVRTPLPEAVLDRARAVSGLLATLFVDKRRGELELDGAGKTKGTDGSAQLLYGKPGRDASLFVGVGEATELEADLRGPAPPPPEPEHEALWIWIAGGAFVAGAAIATALVIASPAPVATDFSVRVGP